MSNNEFKYLLKPDDDTFKRIRRKEDLFGYIESYPEIFPESIVLLSKDIQRDSTIMHNFEYRIEGIDDEFVKASSRLWTELGFKHKPIQIYKPDFEFKKYENLTYIDKEFIDGLYDGYPVDLPIEYVSSCAESTARASYLEFFDHISIVFKDVLIPKIEKNINSCIYAHELTHVAQDSVGGGIEKIPNSETLPILIEMIFGNKLKEDGSTTDELIKHRLAYLSYTVDKILNKKDISFADRIKYDTYIISIIQGLDLFNKYMDGDSSSKKDMITDINKIFQGEIIIEDMLNKYESSYDKVDHNVKTLKKQMIIKR